MAYNNKPMLQDVNGHLIPQYYDPTTDSYQPLQDLTRVYSQGTLTSFKTGSVTVSSSPIELTTGLTGRNQLIIYPPDSGLIYWGTSTVNAQTGAPLKAGDPPMEFTFKDTSLKVYGISDGTDHPIRVVESL